MTTEQIRIRISKEEADSLRKLSDKCGVPYTALVGVFIKAGLEAVKKNNDRVSLPLNFEIKEDCPNTDRGPTRSTLTIRR